MKTTILIALVACQLANSQDEESRTAALEKELAAKAARLERVFAAAPALLDLFMWLSYGCCVAKGPEIIPLFGQYGLTQQLGCIEYSRPSRFRAMLEQWLKAIRSLWPECPASICADGKALRIDRHFAILPNAEAIRHSV